MSVFKKEKSRTQAAPSPALYECNYRKNLLSDQRSGIAPCAGDCAAHCGDTEPILIVVNIARTARQIAPVLTPIALVLMPIVLIGTPIKPVGTRIEATVTRIAVIGTKTGAIDATIAPTGITSAPNDATARPCFVRMPPFLTSIVGNLRSPGI